MSEHESKEFGMSMLGVIGVVLLVAVVYALTVARFTAGAGDPGTPEQIAARIAPIGKVTLAGDAPAPSTDAPAAAGQVSTAADGGPGAAIYTKACVACHAAGAAGAPKLGDKAAWEPRIAQGMNQLLSTAINGKGAMPPRGTCMDCSDEDLKAAIEYMLVQVGFQPDSPPGAGAASSMQGMSGMQGAPVQGGMSGMSGMSGMQGAPVQGGMSGMQGAPVQGGPIR